MIDAGDLNKSIYIQMCTVIRNGYGEPIKTWIDKKKVWAGITTTGGREFYAAQKQNAETSAVIKIRYRKGIKTDQRIRYESRIFEILACIDVEERHDELLLYCKEVI